MKLLPLAALALAVSSFGAAAQSVVDMPSREPPVRDRQANDEQESRHHDHDYGRMHERHMRGSHDERSNRVARFRIDDGQNRIDLRCPDSESFRECADVLMQLVDRLKGPPRDEDDFQRDDRN